MGCILTCCCLIFLIARSNNPIWRPRTKTLLSSDPWCTGWLCLVQVMYDEERGRNIMYQANPTSGKKVVSASADRTAVAASCQTCAT